MAYLIGLPLLASLAVLQATVLGNLRLLEGSPDLILLAVVGWAISGKGHQAMVWGLAGGLILDLLSGLPLGVTAMALILVAALVSFSEGSFWEAHFLMPLSVVLIASLLYYAIVLLWLFIFGRPVELSYALTRVIMPSTFLNVLLALPAAQLAGRLRQSLYPPEVGLG